MESDGESSYYGPGRICCSVLTFKILNSAWGFISLLVFIAGLLGLFLTEGFVLFFPGELYITLAIFGGFSFFIVILGLIGNCAKVEIFFICYIFLNSLLLLIQAFSVIFLFLYLNEVGTLGDVDSAASDAQLVLEDQLFDFAKEEPEQWKDIQDQFECCGISFELFLDNSNDQAIVESGSLCLDNIQNIIDARDDANNGGTDFVDNGIDGNDEFFCNQKFANDIEKTTPFIGAGVGVLMFLQLAAIIAACRTYWVPYWRGGWMFEEDELEELAKEKGIIAPEKDKDFGGPAVFNNIRNAGNRLSFRVKNAVTANPNVPQGAGFLQRLSIRNPQTPFGSNVQRGGVGNRGAGMGGFGNPGEKPKNLFNPNGQQAQGPTGLAMNRGNGNVPPPSFNKRMSNRLSYGLQAVGSAFGNVKSNFRPPQQPRKPPPPPPNFAGTGYAGNPPPSANYNSSRRQNEPSAPPGISGNSNRQTNQGYGSSRSNNYNPPPPRNNNAFGNPPAPDYGSRGTNNSFGGPPPPNYGSNRGTNNSYGNPPAQPNYGSNRGTNNSYGNQPAQPNYGSNRGTNNSYGNPPAQPSYGSNRSDPPPPNYNSRGTNNSFGVPSAPAFGSNRGTNNSYGNPSAPRNNYGSAPPSGRGGTSAALPKPKVSNRFGGFGKGKKKKSKNNAGKGKKGRGAAASPMAQGGLLAQIQTGKGLKPTVSNDRSAPKV